MMQRKTVRWMACAVAACAVVVWANATGMSPGALGWESQAYVSWAGSYSAITEDEVTLVTNAKAWEALWTRHRGDRLEENANGWPEIPAIDFDRCMVLAMFGGESWNCNGYTVIQRATDRRRMLVRVDAMTFQTAGPDGGGKRVTPYGIFVLPRTSLPIIVERDTQGLLAGPRIWKEVARFQNADVQRDPD
jgi:hypothetical protein